MPERKKPEGAAREAYTDETPRNDPEAIESVTEQTEAMPEKARQPPPKDQSA